MVSSKLKGTEALIQHIVNNIFNSCIAVLFTLEEISVTYYISLNKLENKVKPVGEISELNKLLEWTLSF